jgi:dTDP-4-dehydrorhamnose 3,5-epimerase
MKITPLALAGAKRIDLSPIADERGFFAVSGNQLDFAAHDLHTQWVQQNTAFNHHKGTLRGMHFQHPPFAEHKWVRCIAGAIYDVILDLRPDSPTYLQWEGLELSASNRTSLYIPQGLAHGYLTLTDNAEVLYQVSAQFSPQHADGVMWNDPAFGIVWPLIPTVISAKDQTWHQYHPIEQATKQPVSV